jgi:hypothetical protein
MMMPQKQAESTFKEIVEEINEVAGEGLFADGLERALIGYVERFGMEPVALYDRDRCIEILMEDSDVTEEEAVEYFDFNVAGAWVGTSTPAFAVIRRSVR